MASLKEVKGRINSINGTLKITSAMKMVASAKLHKAQEAIENMLPYERRLHNMLTDFLSGGLTVESPYTVANDLHKVAVGDFQHLSGKPNYAEASNLAQELMDKFTNGEVQKVILLYNHFKSTSSQVLTKETFLPINLKAERENGNGVMPDYIVEPSAEQVTRELLPKVLRVKIYSVTLDSAAAEHAARTIAMQVATDNANDLIQELTLQYNKTRQQAITNELLDIVGGSMA